MKVTLLLFFATHHFASSESIASPRQFQYGNTLQSRKNLMKSSSSSTRSIQLAALGRVADLCDFYDNIITKGINEELIRQIEMTFQEMKEAKEYWNANVINTRPVNKKEYFFINNEQGIVIIIDANTYDQVISYKDYEFAESTGAVVNNTFYSINTRLGTIKSTPLENIMTKNFSNNWRYVGSFPREPYYAKNSALVNGSLIYFTNYKGVLYKFDVILKTVTKCLDVIGDSNYGSMVMVDNILYIFKAYNFYSFDGDTLASITLFDKRQYSGLFQLGTNVCVVGGNTTDSSPSPDPVACYDPKEGSWKVHSYINEARKFPGVATSSSGVHIFGGWSWLQGGKLTTSAEVLDVKNQEWSYIASPFSNLKVNLGDYYMQTFTFYF